MSEFDLLTDCLKDVTKERDEARAALEQAQAEKKVSDDLMDSMCTRIEQFEAALRNWLELRDWCIAAGGTEGPLPQDVIQKFAEMQIPIVDAARSLLAGDS